MMRRSKLKYIIGYIIGAIIGGLLLIGFGIDMRIAVIACGAMLALVGIAAQFTRG